MASGSFGATQHAPQVSGCLQDFYSESVPMIFIFAVLLESSDRKIANPRRVLLNQQRYEEADQKTFGKYIA
jgi:hypothetical protein